MAWLRSKMSEALKKSWLASINSLVLKGPDLGSGWQLEAVLPEKGLMGREWSHRNGKRFLNKVATSMGCCIVISKCRNASGTREVIGSPEPTQKLGENPGTVKAVGLQGGVTVAGSGLCSCTFSLPRCLGWMVALCVGLPQGRMQSYQREVPQCHQGRGWQHV